MSVSYTLHRFRADRHMNTGPLLLAPSLRPCRLGTVLVPATLVISRTPRKNLAAKEPVVPSEVGQVQSGANRKGSIGLKLMS